MSELRIEAKLGKIAKSSRYYIIGNVWRGLKKERIEISTRTDDVGIAQAALNSWVEEVRADHEKQKKRQALRDAGVHDDRYEVTLADAAKLYIKQRAEDGKPITDGHEINNLERLVEMYGDELVYNIQPERAIRMARRLKPNAAAATRKRHGTSLIRRLYNAAAVEHAGFEARTFKHDKFTTPERPRADKDWLANFMTLTDEWSPRRRPKWVQRRQKYDLSVPVWRMLIKTTAMFLATTGARIGEMAHINWRDVDWQNNRIFIAGENRKNGQDAYKLLTPALVASLSVLARNMPSEPHLRVFPFFKQGRDACQPMNKRIKEICGDKLPVLTTHELGGHTAVSVLKEQGLSDRQVAHIVDKDESTIRLYGQLSQKESLDAVNHAFGDFFPQFSAEIPQNGGSGR